MGNLSNQYISQSFKSLLHLGSDNTASATLTEVQDALGNGVGVFVSTQGNLRVTNSISASAISASTLFGIGNTVSYSASVSTQLQALENITSSLIAATGSYATTGSNNFVGNQNVSGDLNLTGTLTAYAVKTIFETSSVIYSSGSNQFGDASNDTQTLIGRTNISGSLSVTGSSIAFKGEVSASYISSSRIQGLGIVSDFSSSVASQFYTSTNYDALNDIKWNDLQAVTASQAIAIDNLQIFTASANISFTNLNSFTASQNIKNTTLAQFTGSVMQTTASLNLFSASINSYTSSNDTKWTTLQNVTSSLINQTGSYATTGSNTFIGRQTISNGLTVTGTTAAMTSSISSISASLNVTSLDINLLALSGAVRLKGTTNNGIRMDGNVTFYDRAETKILGSIAYISQSAVIDAWAIGGDGNWEIRIHSGSATAGGTPYNRVSINEFFNVEATTSGKASGSVSLTGSLNVSKVLKLGQSNPLPTGTDGSMAVSASNLYFYSGSDWRKVSLV